ncbi:FAD-dependent oxidoreductase [Ramlibacter sp. AW1]|uniref:FAD-dependent oxidoreductase n=2 Tax=Ramlibacter aurantiacus TaxID=2801330 RepID=A0A936ZIE2_9BURK|nr:FAD-dependent oxidoreductase [Ramlibacter aurantiacus]MBL0420422.1 FAD-dependent oxidoreductase [Ramlibacter aurantiacus]
MQRSTRNRSDSSTGEALEAAAAVLQTASEEVPQPEASRTRRVAVVGAGIAGLACARTLVQAGHEVTVFEREEHVGGRMGSLDSPFGSFDHGVQYFTVRDERFARVLKLHPGLCKPWSARAVRVLDPHGRVAEVSQRPESRWVGQPRMDALPRAWAEPLQAAGRLRLGTRVLRIEPARSGGRWRLACEGAGGETDGNEVFDQVLLAVPAPQAAQLLRGSELAPELVTQLEQVHITPCWTLMLAFPNAQPAGRIGPQWNAASSSHHRIAWLSRESSKPGRAPIERWTVQASSNWSAEHLEDDGPRVAAKLLRGFAEVTGIRAEPSDVQVVRWRHAQTHVPLGRSHLRDAALGLGACGDWCLGHRVEDAFVSGLELALATL